MNGRKTLNCIFVFALLLALLAGLGRTLLRPKDINYYEKRYAVQPPALRASDVLDGSFQDQMEDALADQIPAAQRLKRFAHMSFSTYQRRLVQAVAQRMPDRLLNIGGMRIYNGYLLYWFRPLTREQAQLDKKIANLNAAFAAAPETEFTVYYLEKDTDFNFETGQSNGVADYLRANLDLPAGRFGCFSMRSFDDLCEFYYRTDHHWSYRGSYRGYLGMLSLLAPSETPLVPLETRELGPFGGSKAGGRERGSYRETFCAYRFDYPEMEITVNGAPADDYGEQERFFAGVTAAELNYANFYGDDLGWVSFHVPANAGKGSLLVIGDSFDNAVLKLLAAHFEDTWSLDLRYYEVQMGQPFRLNEFLAEHPGTKVLLTGNLDYFVMDEFALEG